MKKIVPILLAVALALALCLVGFADAERYDDEQSVTKKNKNKPNQEQRVCKVRRNASLHPENRRI